MGVRKILECTCDAPGCDKTGKVLEQDLEKGINIPPGWREEEVGDTPLIACSSVHMVAAIANELGYQDVAKAMLDLKVPPSPQAEKPAEPSPPVLKLTPAPGAGQEGAGQ